MAHNIHMKFSGYERFVILILSFLQFTVILDFMIMAPLGAILMPKMNISPAQFSFAVSVYAFGAGVSGILASGFADRFDRKRILLFFYTGFLIGTLFCGMAPSYEMLVAARMFTGVFAGVLGSVVMAIITDLFDYNVRGQVIGVVQAAFSASQILGLPIGLYLATHLGWHAPFVLIVAVGMLAGVAIVFLFRPIDKHLLNRVDRHPLHHLAIILGNRSYLSALFATSLLAVGGFMMMPFGSAFSVNNLGISLEQLPILYFIIGGVTFFSSPLVGRACDAFGKFRVFAIGTAVTCILVPVYTNLEVTPLPVVAVLSSLFFLGIFSRMIPAQALMSAIPSAENRGGFMAVGSALQQFAGGLASLVAGHIVSVSANGRIEHYPMLGIVLVATSLVTLWQMYYINTSVQAQLKGVETEPNAYAKNRGV